VPGQRGGINGAETDVRVAGDELEFGIFEIRHLVANHRAVADAEVLRVSEVDAVGRRPGETFGEIGDGDGAAGFRNFADLEDEHGFLDKSGGRLEGAVDGEGGDVGLVDVIAGAVLFGDDKEVSGGGLGGDSVIFGKPVALP